MQSIEDGGYPNHEERYDAHCRRTSSTTIYSIHKTLRSVLSTTTVQTLCYLLRGSPIGSRKSVSTHRPGVPILLCHASAELPPCGSASSHLLSNFACKNGRLPTPPRASQGSFIPVEDEFRKASHPWKALSHRVLITPHEVVFDKSAELCCRLQEVFVFLICTGLPIWSTLALDSNGRFGAVVNCLQQIM